MSLTKVFLATLFVAFSAANNQPKIYSATLSQFGTSGVSGYVSLARTGDGKIYLKSLVTGLGVVDCSTSGGACGQHIHDGTACTDASTQGGHLTKSDGTDPWDGTGLSENYTTTGYKRWDAPMTDVGTDYADLVGKPFVVHGADGSRVACGILSQEVEPVFRSQLSALSGGTEKGTVWIMSGKYGLFVWGAMTGVTGSFFSPQQNGGGGLHVHSGTSCADTAAQGGHYYDDSASIPQGTGGTGDPWNDHTYLTTDETTTITATADMVIPFAFFAFTGDSVLDINKRVFLFHNADGGRAACGVIHEIPRLYEATLSQIGTTGVDGQVAIMWSGSGAQSYMAFQTIVNGLGVSSNCSVSAAACGQHVHSGTACDSASTQEGHLLNPTTNNDPWAATGSNVGSTSNTNDPAGSSVDYITPGADYPDIDGKPFVVHDVSGNRASCGILHEVFEPAVYTTTLAAIDSSSSDAATGPVTIITGTIAEVVFGELTIGPGLTFTNPQTSGAGGLHVHSGTSCTNATTQGGHYFDSNGFDPWGLDTFLRYGQATLGTGAAAPSTAYPWAFPVVAGSSWLGIGSKPFVFHGPNGDRESCGVMTQFEKIIATPTPDPTATPTPASTSSAATVTSVLTLLVASVVATRW